MATMTLLYIDRLSQRGLMLLVLLALAVAPFVNAKTLAASFTVKIDTGLCKKMQKMGMAQLQQGSSICSDQKNSNCKVHCENLFLSYLPVPVLLEPFAFQARSMRSVQLASSQTMRGVFLPLDPRPPQS